jgi:acetylornithine/succinyldiaminopimelate/putrescine aminotransferase
MLPSIFSALAKGPKLRGFSNLVKYLPSSGVRIVKEKGAFLYDDKGRELLNVHCNYGSAPFSAEAFAPVFRRFAENKGLPLVDGSFENPEKEKLAERLCAKAASATGMKADDYEVVFYNSGTEAVELGGLKIPYFFAKDVKKIKDGEAIIISFSGAFHGRTVGLSSLNSVPAPSYGGMTVLPGIIRLPWNDSEKLEEAFDKYGSRIAGALIEIIQGEGGLNIVDKGFLLRVQNLCKKHNALFGVDDVQAGLGRIGPFFSFELFSSEDSKITPDIICVAKMAGGGICPVSAVIMRKDLAKLITVGRHNSTYGGNPFAIAIFNHVLDLMENLKVEDNIKRQEPLIKEGLEDLRLRYPMLINGVDGVGLWHKIMINDDLDSGLIKKTLLSHGILTGKIGLGEALRIQPHLDFSEELVREMVGRFDKGFAAVVKEIGKYRKESDPSKSPSHAILDEGRAKVVSGGGGSRQ